MSEHEDALALGDFEAHPAAAAFPLIYGGEYDALVEDIRVNGLREPIWVTTKHDYEYRDHWLEHPCWEHERVGCQSCAEWVVDDDEIEFILDGRNRLRACFDAGVTPKFRRFEVGDPIAFVVSMNIRRRHLDESQRGMIAARLAKLPKGANQHASIDAPSQTQAAELMNVDRSTVQRGRVVLERGIPELVSAVDRGEKSISWAADKARLLEAEQRRALDPSYGNAKVEGTVSGAADYESDEWYTPLDIVEAAREVLGAIDLDPATCDFAQQRIRAQRFFTREDDGLTKLWCGRIWLNPPYSPQLARAFAEKLIEEWRAGRVTAAVMVQNASTDTGWFHALAQESTLCLTRGRINFDRADGLGSQNRYGQVFFYFGRDSERFEDVFSRFGLVGKLRGC